MRQKPSTKEVLLSDLAILFYLAAFKLVLHLYFNRYYGYQRDELYFIACGEHLAWGYVDVGPLAMWLGRLSREVLGESLSALRFLPAVAGAVTVFLTGLLARELGGRRYAQCLAALSIIIAPVWLQSGNILALPSFEPLFWVLCAYLVVRIIKTDNPRLWLWVGVVAGIGLLNKPSMAFFGVALVIGLLLTPHRKYLTDKWLWAGGAIAFVIVLPYLYWQMTHGWATLQFLIGMNRGLMTRIPRVLFAIGQVFYVHPVNVAVWLAGLGYYLVSKEGKAYRPLGWVYVIVCLFMVIVQSKIYYLAPAYPMLLAAGAVAIERFVERRRLRWLRVAAPAALVAGGLATVPIGLPVLPIDKLDAYVNAITGGALEHVYEVTGTFHDQFGWEDKAAVVADVYHGLPPEDKAKCMIFAGNFGQAGAIDFYGAKYGLPPATCAHQNYFFWGPPERDPELAVVLGVRPERLEMVFGRIEQVALIECPECLPFEDNLPVYLCREPKVSLEDFWPTLRAVAFRNW